MINHLAMQFQGSSSKCMGSTINGIPMNPETAVTWSF